MEQSKLKSLLNNLTLLKWVRKFSANGLLEDNKMAKDKFNIKSSEDSISVLDNTATKLLITNAEFNGEELVRFNIRQLSDLLEVIATKDGELIIPKKSNMNEMIAQIKSDIVVICPLAKKDSKKD